MIAKFSVMNISYDPLLNSDISGKSGAQPFSEQQNHPPFKLGTMYPHPVYK